MLYEMDDVVHHAYFPHDAVFSLVNVMEDGDGVVTLNSIRRIEAALDAGQAQAAMLAADFHSEMALRR
jgi:hypothetical protein